MYVFNMQIKLNLRHNTKKSADRCERPALTLPYRSHV